MLKMLKNFKKLRYIHIAVFVCGMSGMSIEMAASRLLAPFFGSSIFVWTNVIGMVLIGLSAGYYFGGKYADKHPNERHFYQIIFSAGLFIGIIPLLSDPILQFSIEAFITFSVSSFLLSFIGALILFVIPLFFLGFISPFAIRIETKKIKNAGKISGRIYSLSTVGSIIGVYIPALLTLPFIGTKKTIYLFSIFLLLIAVFGLRRHIFKKLKIIKHLNIITTLIIIILALMPSGMISSKPNTIYECESAYNYIRVFQEGNAIYLELNEGLSVQSVYVGDNELSGMYWDYFLSCPNFNYDTKNIAIIGLAGGTIVGYYYKFFPEIHINGVEIDSKLIEVGRKYFNMTYKNLNTIEMDGRLFVKTTKNTYDVVIIDAYGYTYIPFHLATKEFFQEIKDTLESDGIVAINVAVLPGANRLMEVIGNTLLEVFPEVYTIPIGYNIFEVTNWMVIAPKNRMSLDQIKANFTNTKDAADSLDITPSFDIQKYKQMLDNSNNRIARFIGTDDIIFTDDIAPIEIMAGMMIFQGIP